MKNTFKLLGIIAFAVIIIACDAGGGGSDSDKYWLISSQKTYTVTNGKVDESSYSSIHYDWVAYRYKNETDYEEEYTTLSGSYMSHSVSDYHFIRNGQTSNSTNDTISKTSYNGSSTVSSGISYTNITYDSESGLIASSTTDSSGTTTLTVYAIELLSETGGIKTYKYYNAVAKNGYEILERQNGRTLKSSYYDANYTLMYTTTYTYPDNKEIRSKLPNFTLSNTQYYSSSYSINSSYQTADVLPNEDKGDIGLQVRVRTFNDGIISGQIIYMYYKENFNSISGGQSLSGYSGVRPASSGDYIYYEKNGKIAIAGYKNKKFKGTINIPEQINGKPVIGIGCSVFRECYRFIGLTIPDSITSIIGYSESTSSAFFDFWSLANVIIGNGITNIGNRDFSECPSLTSVTIGSGVTSIGTKAFTGCPNLTSVTFLSIIPSENLGSYDDYDHFGLPFDDGDLCDKYLAGGQGTYTRMAGASEWTKQY